MSSIPEFTVHSTRRLWPAADAVGGESDFARSLVLQQPRVARLVQRLLGWPAGDAAADTAADTDVEDVVQEVLVSAWMHRARFRGESQLGTWVARIAINEVRRNQRRRRIVRRLFRRAPDLTKVPAPPEEFDARAEAMRRGLAELPHGDREILVLRYLEAHGIDELAPLLGVSVSTVHQRLSRARKRLREITQRLGEADEL